MLVWLLRSSVSVFLVVFVFDIEEADVWFVLVLTVIGWMDDLASMALLVVSTWVRRVAMLFSVVMMFNIVSGVFGGSVVVANVVIWFVCCMFACVVMSILLSLFWVLVWDFSCIALALRSS